MKRDITIDTAKGIGIFLVVFGHLNLQEPMQTIIYSFHIPLFFIISGMVFRRNKYGSWKKFLVRRLHTLIYPYLLFALTTLAFYTTVQFLKSGFTRESVQFFIKYFIQVFIAQYSLIYGPNTPMWFVPCLFLTECIYYHVSTIKNYVMRCGAIIIIVVFGWFTQSDFCHWDFSLLPWNISGACFALGFYAIGNIILQEKRPFLNEWYKNLIPVFKLILFLSLSILLYSLSMLNGHVSIGSRILQNGFVFYLTGIVGSALVFMLSERLTSIKLLPFWGKNSFVIMATHFVFYNIFSGIYQLIGGESLADTKTSFVHSMIAIATVMAACSAFSILYNKVTKRLV